MRNKQISVFLICLLFASSCGGTSDNGDDAAIEKLEAQVEAFSQQLEKETPAEATPEETSTNEITVSPDAIVTTTTEASSLTSDDGMYLQTELLKFVNYTDVPTEFLQENANLASSKMHSRNSDVIAIIYPLGRFISDEASSYGGTFLGAEFEVVLTNDQINELVDELQDFLEQAECQSSSEIKKFTSEVKQWLEIGGGSQLQAVFCPDVRVVLYSIDEDRRRDFYDIQRVFFHELYHAFQQDLGFDCEAENSSLWVIEGAADYFANFLLAEIEDRPETLAESILQPALMLSEETGKAFKDPGVAEKGMIGLRLMVERGWLDESKIIDGSLFHNCVRMAEFQDSNPRIQFVKNMWHSVEEKNQDQFVFTNEALNREPDERDFTALSNPVRPVEHLDVLIDQLLQAVDAVIEGDLFFADCAYEMIGEKVFELLTEIPIDEDLLLLEECLYEFAFRNGGNRADTVEAPNPDIVEVPNVKTVEARNANSDSAEPSGECKTVEQEMCWEWGPEASQHNCGPDTGASALDSEHCWAWKMYKPYVSIKKTDLVFRTPNSDEEAMAQRLIDLGWNSIQSSPASYFVTSDLSDDSLEAVKSGIQAAEEYLGSYGPMRVYIIGSRTSATDAAIEDYCTWAYDPEWMERCRNDQGVGIYEIAYYMGSNAFAQHSRGRSVPTQSFVSGNPLNVGVGDGSKIAAHEYVHIYQNAHQLYQASDMFGLDIPIWIEEGSAEFLALYLADQKGWLSFRQRMEDALNEAKWLRGIVPGLTIEDIADSRERVAEYCGLCFGVLQYATGQWATAWLTNRTSVDSVFFDYFPSFYELGPDGAFEDAFGLTISEFYVEFEKFMQLPFDEQMAILPNP